MSVLRRVSVVELVELFCKYWKHTEDGRPCPTIFDKILIELNVPPIPGLRKKISCWWDTNFQNLRDKVNEALLAAEPPRELILPFEFNLISQLDLKELIRQRILFQRKLRNGLIPCPNYYRKFKCVIAKFGNFKVSNENLSHVESCLAALLKNTGCEFIPSNHANVLLSGIIPPDPSFLDFRKFIAVYKRSNASFTVFANVTEKKAVLLVPAWAEQNEASVALSCLIGPQSANFSVCGVTCDSFNESSVLEFVTQVLNLKVNLSQESLQAHVLFNSDDMFHICVKCGEDICIGDLCKICKCCARSIHYQCYHTDDYIPEDKTLCEVCDSWDKLSLNAVDNQNSKEKTIKSDMICT